MEKILSTLVNFKEEKFMKISKGNFDVVIDACLNMATKYLPAGRNEYKGFFVSKKERRMYIINSSTLCRLSNVEFSDELGFPDEEVFFNITPSENGVIGHLTENPYRFEASKVFETTKSSMDVVGRTSMFGNNILNILLSNRESVENFKTRYIFQEIFLPENVGFFNFNIINGEPHYEIPGTGIKFDVSDQSLFPKNRIREKETYACEVIPVGDREVMLNCICKSGRVKSFLCITPKNSVYNSNLLSDLNSFNGKYDIPELTVCSDTLEMIKPNVNVTMPPIHLGGTVLLNALKVFTLSQSSRFDLLFEEGLSRNVVLMNRPQSDDDIVIEMIVAPLDLSKKIQMG